MIYDIYKQVLAAQPRQGTQYDDWFVELKKVGWVRAPTPEDALASAKKLGFLAPLVGERK